GLSSSTRRRSPAIVVSAKTGTSWRRALAITASASPPAIESVPRTKPMTQDFAVRDSSAVAVVIPRPTRSTLPMSNPSNRFNLDRLQTVVSRIRLRTTEELADLEPAGLKTNHGLRTQRRRQDAHVSAPRRLHRPYRDVQAVEDHAVDVSPELRY